MDGPFVTELRDSLVRPVVETVEERQRLVVPKGWTELQYVHASTEALGVSTLTGITDYLKHNVDRLNLEELIIHVVDPWTVELLERVEDESKGYRRKKYVIASSSIYSDGGSLRLGEYIDAEKFFVSLQTAFEETDERNALMTLIGSIKESTVREIVDDKVSQAVNVAQGIRFVGTATVPNPVVLRPYRTFREIEQPSSLFVFRLRSNDNPDKRPLCALFEGDGSSWKLAAIQSIGAWFNNKLQENNQQVAVLA